MAEIVSTHYAQLPGPHVKRLLGVMGRPISVDSIQRLTRMVAQKAADCDAVEQALIESPPGPAAVECLRYEPASQPKDVGSIVVSLDGAHMPLGKKWKEATVGTITLRDAKGKRLETARIACPPETKRGKFLRRMAEEVRQARERFPKAVVLGVADGCEQFQMFLKDATDRQTLDFWHATEHLREAGEAVWPWDGPKRKEWFALWKGRLKHNKTGVGAVRRELRRLLETKPLTAAAKKKLKGAAVFFRNQGDRMNYVENAAMNLPIGSGVVEAACKTLVKARMCVSGARWKEVGAGDVLRINALGQSDGRWEQFWGWWSQGRGLPKHQIAALKRKGSVS